MGIPIKGAFDDNIGSERKLMYGLTADKLHEYIIDSLRYWCNNMSIDITDILERHQERPLEQTICKILMATYLQSSNRLPASKENNVKLSGEKVE